MPHLLTLVSLSCKVAELLLYDSETTGHSNLTMNDWQFFSLFTVGI